MKKHSILFIHQAFPGQFGSLAASLAAEGHRVVALAMNPSANVKGVTLVRHVPDRKRTIEKLSSCMQEMDTKYIRAESALKAMKALKAKGFNPDVIYAHPGWGDAMYVKEVWPNARYVVYAEWFYNKNGQEVNFDPAMPKLTENQELRLHAKNAPFLQALSEADALITPTRWQNSRFPKWAQRQMHIIHDGLNLREIAQIQPRSLALPAKNVTLSKGMPIITYCARHLEPVRGFHYFMRALPEIQKQNPEAHIVIIGNDAGVTNPGYCGVNSSNESWRTQLQAELGDKVDWNKIHFMGEVSREVYLALLKLSACHVYLSAPFILSWSFLEAAAIGAPIVASDTPPVREMKNLSGLKLANFSSPEEIAQKVTETLREGAADYSRENLEKLKDFDHHVTLPKIRRILLGGSATQPSGSASQPVGAEGKPVEKVVFV